MRGTFGYIPLVLSGVYGGSLRASLSPHLRAYSARFALASFVTRNGQMYCFSIVVLIVVGLAMACGSDAGDTGGAESAEVVDEKAIVAIGDRLEISAWTRPNVEFGYDEFIAVGWKQHQVYEVDTLPNALEARYGFYNRRDVEIRRYPSHEVAMSDGTASAAEALDRTVHDGSGFTSRRVYGGYLVAGNLVMMCEVSTDDCVGLIEAVEAVE